MHAGCMRRWTIVIDEDRCKPLVDAFPHRQHRQIQMDSNSSELAILLRDLVLSSKIASHSHLQKPVLVEPRISGADTWTKPDIDTP